MTTFLLVKKEGYTPGGTKLAANTIAGMLLHAGVWPIYNGTKGRLMFTAGDRVVIYVGGDIEIIGEAFIEKIVGPEDVALPINRDAIIHSILILHRVEHYSFDFAKHRARLTFVPNHSKWGACLMGGARQIPDADYLTIRRLATTEREKPNVHKGRAARSAGENSR